ncbi:aliphatic sulfonate ABC transporter substrate-binding protein [Paenibacillus sp. y28]|uniref:aliphatic sulfonate ABC transporter substrate-binding protein n=1 Tax=Paenibacillus sp. y28 TaxID=3129110 RepID=UPI00301AE6E0
MKGLFSSLKRTKSTQEAPTSEPEAAIGNTGEAAEWDKLVHASRSLADSSDSFHAYIKTSIENVESVSSAIHQIVTSATRQSAEAEASFSTSEQLGQDLDETVRKVQQMNEWVSRTLQASGAGKQSVLKLSSESSLNSRRSEQLQLQMKDLKQTSESISHAITMIASTAKQIQLLAINASIEAAHAGDHGRGFAVVAQEIRKLAQESESSGQQIRKLLESVQQQVNACSQGVDASLQASRQVDLAVNHTEDAFERIDTHLHAVTEASSEAFVLLEQAKTRKGQLLDNIHHLTSLSQKSLSSAVEVADLSERQASSVLTVAGAAQDLQAFSGEMKKSMMALSRHTAALTGSGSLEDVRRSVIRIGLLPNLTHAPALIALERGLFAEQFGRQLEIRLFSAGPALVNALTQGQLDIGYTGPSPVFEAAAQQKPVRILAGASHGGAALLVKGGSGITAPGQLRGKTVAVPQFGNSQHVLLKQVLRDHGLSDKFRGGDVRIVQLKPSLLAAAFQNGEADAALVPEPWAALLEAEQGARLLLDWRSLHRDGLYPNTVVAVNLDFFRSRAEQAAQFLHAHRQALSLVQKGQPGVVQSLTDALEKHTGQRLAPDTIREALRRIVWHAEADAGSLDDFARITRGEGFLKQDVDVRQLLLSPPLPAAAAL